MYINFGPILKKIVRASAVLTTSYVAGTVVDQEEIKGANQLLVLVDFTLGSLTDGRIKVEFSHDGLTYYQETDGTVSGASSLETLIDHKFTATGKYRLAIPIMERYIKISVIGTGTVTNSLMTVDAVVGGA